ncbi:filamin-A-like isoform X1 [Mytilus trossulus]|uniref:filamin-A-like isoform X1 n=1 Tax=Mytilus trossulus TaxID=6551 RepID=UPI0030053BB0
MSARALSREGHAAMSLRGETDRWVLIQQNTFTNWVNEQLRIYNCDLIEDLQTDFSDGVRLCYLVEALQGKKIGRVIKNPRNHHQNLENVSKALNAIANDNVRLVNIGSDDIVTGNLKLILGLIWHLILRYQIGKTKFPTKKLMLAWIQAVIPECGIGNFTTDWNDGIALNALVDFCRPGLAPDWRHMSRSSGLDNCRVAMQLAKDNFDIPLVVRPEDLASPDLDELSGMTYLSYFMKIDSPGYFATLKIIQSLLKYGTCNNFASDWQDGHLLANLVKSLGENVPNLTGSNSENIQKGLEAAQRLGVNPILTAKEMCDPEVDHIGIMAYAAYFKDFKPTKTPAERVVLSSPPKNVFVGLESNFSVRIEDDNVSPSDVRAEIKGPDSSPNVRLSWTGSIGDGLFTPEETGVHRLSVFCNNQLILGCPVTFKSMADRSRISFTSVESCPVGMITELKVDSSGAGQGDVRVEAQSPGGRIQNLTAVYRHGQYIVNFSPSESGVWNLSVLYDGEHISGSPYSVVVYDPASVRVYGLEGGIVGSDLTFHADHSSAGDGDLDVNILYEGSRVPANVTEDSRGVNRINFTPQGAGIYKVHVNFNGTEVKGSPYMVEIFGGGRATVSGDGLSLVPLNKTAYFNVDTQGSSSKVDVEITGPTGQRVNKVVKRKSSGLYQVEYIPTEVGEHKIDVFHGGHPIQSGPFKAKVYSSDGIIVSNVPHVCMYGNPVKFNINAEKAGPGNIEIMINSGTIPCQVQTLNEHEDKYFEASFIPEGPKPHLVELKFNKKEVIGSPWTVAVIDPGSFSVTGDGLYLCHTNKKASFNINNKGEINQSFLHIKISAPSKRTVPYNIRRSKEGHVVEYIPTEVGDHRIEIKYGDSEIEGSPFTAKAYDTHAIRVSRFGDTLVGKSVDFTIDVTSAGEGQLEIMVNNGNLPNTVEMENAGVYKIAFIPEQAGKQYVDINFNREPLPDSPFTCMALDVTGALVRGLKSVLPTDKASTFTIQSEGVGSLEAAVDVQIYSPSGKKMLVKKSHDNSEKELLVEFEPREVGEYQIDLKVGDHHIMESPYTFKTFGPSEVEVTLVDRCFTKEECTLHVDASKAGEGMLQVIILADGTTVDHDLITKEDGMYDITFTPELSVRHRVHLTFNEEYVPGSPFWIECADETEFVLKQFKQTQFVACYKDCGFTLEGTSGLVEEVSADIRGPSGKEYDARVRENSPGMYSLEWCPTEIGDHLATIYLGRHVAQGFPQIVKVYDADKVVATIRSHGYVGELYKLNFDVSESGEGALEVIVECEGETIPVSIHQTQIGMLAAEFTPQTGKDHMIYAKFNGDNVPGSPFTIEVIDRNCSQIDGNSSLMVKQTSSLVQSSSHNPVYVTMEKHLMMIHQSQWFLLQSLLPYMDPEHLQVVIIAENGDKMPSRLSTNIDGTMKVEWTPVMAGQHRVEIYFGGQPIEGSPYYVDVFDVASIRVSRFNQRGVGEPASFDVDLSQASRHDYDVIIKSPSGRTVDHSITTEDREWTKNIAYIPDESGPYSIYVSYAGYELPGCPYIQNIDDGGLPTATGDGLYSGEENKNASFSVDVGNRVGDLGVKVEGPNSIAKTTLEQKEGRYIVSYVPVEVGVFTLVVTWNGKDIPGSPFHPKVVNPHKVEVVGGWQQILDNKDRVHLVVGEPKHIAFDISEAGPGHLTSEVTGPTSSLHSVIEATGSSQVTMTFTPEQEGNHYIHLQWSKLALPKSPLLGYAVHGRQDNKVILTGRGLKEASVREEAEFNIDGTQAGPGTPEVTLTGVKAEIPVKVIAVAQGKYRCQYVPVIPGAYLLNITWNNRQLRGSPYKVNVIGAFYPNKVTVSGEGLTGGIAGRSLNVTIDTRKAGPGELTASCMGPNKAAYCELEDNRDGTFELRIKPQEIGRHVLQVKYGGEHVQGSPFIIKVSAPPDASKVRVTGPGVEHGILAKFQSKFIVETKGAGAGQLTVRVRGPKGSFRVEMKRDSQRDRTILCQYYPTEIGDYHISVKWSSVDVPGSPFLVHIVDTMAELEEVMRSSMSAGRQPTPRSYDEWREKL